MRIADPGRLAGALLLAVLAIAAAPAPSATQEADFAVQVGAYRQERFAEALATRIRSKGFEPRLVRLEPNGLLLVRVGRFGSHRLASELAGRLRAAGFPVLIVADAARERPAAPPAATPAAAPPAAGARPQAVATAPAPPGGAQPAATSAEEPAGSAGSAPAASDSVGPAPPRRRLSSEAVLASVFDSNVEHDETGIDAYGVVVGAAVAFRSRSLRPRLQLRYTVGLHSYAGTDKWDRVSHLARAMVDVPVGGPFLVGLTAEGSLKGSSEDRQVGDQLAILPRVELRPDGGFRLRLTAAQRWRSFDGRRSLNRYAGIDARAPIGPGTLEAAARFEWNRPELTRYRFERRTFSTRYTAPVGRRDELEFQVKYTPVHFPERLVEVDDDREEPRRDRKWSPRITWIRDWTGHLTTELEYEFEMRFSNDPDKAYRGHVLTLSTTFAL